MTAGAHGDRMTPKERIGALAQGLPTDRIPTAPLVLNHAARVCGVKISKYNRDGEVMGRCHVAA